MRTQEIEKAPSRIRESGPMTAEAVNEYSTTIWGTRSGNKPDYLINAEREAIQARSEYDWLIANGVHHEGALTEAWDAFTIAENKRRDAWEAYQDGLDFVPCEF